PAGTAEIADAFEWRIRNLSARQHGWRIAMHSDHVDQDFEEVWVWWGHALSHLPVGTEGDDGGVE
ncbi:MAG: hypothetical protein AAFY88_19355, partial [Acidobacteriota bacterium]